MRNARRQISWRGASLSLLWISTAAWTETLTGPKILERVFTAMGGREAVCGLTCVSEQGTVSSLGLSGTYSYSWTPTACRLDSDGVAGRIVKGCDAEGRLWSVDRAGWVGSDGRGLTALPHTSSWLSYLHYLAQQPPPAFSASATAAPNHVVLRLTLVGEFPSLQLRVQDDTWELEEVAEWTGDDATRYVLRDWKAVGGVRLPHEEEVTQGLSVLRRKTSLAVNGAVAPTLFARPPQTLGLPGGVLPLTLQMEEDRQWWYVKAQLGESEEPGWLIVDTGASTTVLVDQAVPASATRFTLSGVKAVVAEGTASVATIVRLPSWHLEGLTLTSWWANTMPGQRLPPHARGRRVLGLLGQNFFRRFLVNIEPGPLRLILWPIGAERPRQGVTWLPLTYRTGIPYLGVAWNGHPAWMMVDSGAPLLNIFVSRWPLDREELRFPLNRSGVGVIHSLQVGPITLKEPEASPIPKPGWKDDGVFGHQFLSRIPTWWDAERALWGVEGGPEPQVLESPPVYYRR